MTAMQKFSIKDIESAVCARYRIHPVELQGKLRARRRVRPRQVAIYLARELTQASLHKLGRRFNIDHTTVLWSQRRIAEFVATDIDYATTIAGIKEILDHAATGRAAQ
jgi:chromosomal replication initiator protein